MTLKPGIEIKPGASFYAGVSDENCSCGGVLGMSKSDDNTNRLSEEQYFIQENSLQTEINDVNLLEVKLYPNPGKDIVNIAVEGATVKGFEYKVFSLTGVLIEEQEINSNATQLFLKKGVYIVKIKYNNEWHTKKLIMH